MTQTWTGRSLPWLVPLVTFFTVVAMAVFLWSAFFWLSPDNFRAGKAAVGLAGSRALAVVLCLGGVWVVRRILQANAPTIVTLSTDELIVQHGRVPHTIRLADVDAVLWIKATVQSTSGLFVFPREEYLAQTGSRVRYGNADPDLMISCQRFTDEDEFAMVRALREAVKGAGGRFGTSVGVAEPTDEDMNVERTASGRLRVAKPGTGKDPAAPRLPRVRFTSRPDGE